MNVAETTPRLLPSGRSVVIRQADGNDQVEVRSPDGVVEVCITLTDTGPVVRLRGARLELESVDEIRLRCRHFAVEAAETAAVQSAGEVRVTAGGDMRLDGRMIYLNS